MGLISSFLGKDQKNAIQGAKTQADAALTAGYNAASSDYDAAAGTLQPYADSGVKANKMYADLLGENGTDARDTAEGTVTSDPMYNGGLNQQENAMLRYLNSRGQSAGGKAQLAGQRVLQQNWQTTLGNYKGASDSGAAASNELAGVQTGKGQLAYGYGATQAGNDVNYGNAMAAAANTPWNNIIGLAGAAASGAKTAASAGAFG